jgi:pantothenate synthetase
MKPRIQIPKDEVRSAEASSLKDAIARFLEAYRLEQSYQEAVIVNTWREIAAAHTGQVDKVYVHGRTLFVSVSSATLRHQFLMTRGVMLQELHTRLGAALIDNIVLL